MSLSPTDGGLLNNAKTKMSYIDVNKLVVSIKSRYLWESVLLGQVISLLICSTAVSSQILAVHFQIHIPTAQSFVNYLLLATFFNFGLYLKRRSMAASRYSSYTKYYWYELLRKRGFKYFLIALVDVEANYFMVKAYQFTTLTSIQLLDCLVIPTVMLLSIFFLRARYKLSHFLGVFICIIGVAFLIFSDHQQRTSGTDEAKEIPTNKFLGDMLCLLGAVLYGLSNIGQEFFVKKFDKYEFLAMIGTFGTLINGIQFLILERNELPLKVIAHLKPYALILLAVFTAAMFCLYYCMAVAISRSSALAVNLSMLSADFYVLFLGIFFFQYKFNALFLLAFILIINGVIIYNLSPAAEPGLTNASAAANSNGQPGHNSSFAGNNGNNDSSVIAVRERDEDAMRLNPSGNTSLGGTSPTNDLESAIGDTPTHVNMNDSTFIKPETIVTPSDLAMEYNKAKILANNGHSYKNFITSPGSSPDNINDNNPAVLIITDKNSVNTKAKNKNNHTPLTKTDFENINFSVNA